MDEHSSVRLNIFSEKVKTTVINKRRKREAYSSADIQNAIKDYLTSKCKSLREAARKYGVPASTLNEKFNGLSQNITYCIRSKTNFIFSLQEQHLLFVHWGQVQFSTGSARNLVCAIPWKRFSTSICYHCANRASQSAEMA